MPLYAMREGVIDQRSDVCGDVGTNESTSALSPATPRLLSSPVHGFLVPSRSLLSSSPACSPGTKPPPRSSPYTPKAPRSSPPPSPTHFSHSSLRVFLSRYLRAPATFRHFSLFILSFVTDIRLSPLPSTPSSLFSLLSQCRKYICMYLIYIPEYIIADVQRHTLARRPTHRKLCNRKNYWGWRT